MPPQPDRRWSVASETGRLTDVLLCRPDYFDWAPSNAIVLGAMAAGRRPDRKAAAAQHRELEDALRGSGVACHFLEPDAGLRYQTYTRDVGFMTPWGLVACCMARPERRSEWSPLTDAALRLGLPRWRTVTAGSVEGGDVQVLKPGLLLIGVAGDRTDAAGAAQVRGWFEAEGWRVREIRFPAHFLHLDVVFAMAAEGLALVCPDALEEGDLSWARAEGVRLLPVGYRDAMRMGCNVVALGEGRVLSARQNAAANARLRAEGLTVLDPDLDEFITEGGAAHCLTLPLRRETP